MIQVDLVLLAEKLRIRGCEACHEILAGPHGYQEGLDVEEDFGFLGLLIVDKSVNDAVLCGDEHAVAAVAGVGQHDGSQRIDLAGIGLALPAGPL